MDTLRQALTSVDVVPAGLAALRAAFPPVSGYLDAATLGLPPRAVTDTLRAALDDWQAGRPGVAGYGAAVEASRRAYARLVGVDPSAVAIGSQASVLVGLVAASLPDGAEVVVPHGDFTSVVFPFLVHADRGIRVRHVPLEALAEQIRPGTAAVAFSLAQSADGRVADVAAIRAAAAAAGALTVCDTTQAAGWLPVRAGDFDVTVCAAYKWLCSPRGTAFLTVGPGVADRLRPIHAGWYAGESIWDSVYGPDMRLAADARRFDVSPAWLAWAGAAPALELFAATDPHAVHRHDTRLADDLLDGLGLPPRGQAIIALADPEGTLRQRLHDAGCTVAGRAGRVRIAFHVWND
ncbi:MAG TPA: aminotransferase class V-fold PLP-dependent enzyme, partial [Kineosporiaceae bacterium]|nr:aminotransferase class V-fold PLP-dependent enzyme [Kineosporiaceae bacterium]